MSTSYSIRHAIHPNDSKTYDTAKLREAFLIEDLFQKDAVQGVYTMYDRLIVGGAQPANKPLPLESFPTLRSENFLDRRELGIINIGAESTVTVDGEVITLANKEALYVGMGTKEVIFHPAANGADTFFYFNSAPAHRNYPTKKVALDQAETVEMGSLENSNHRIIRKLLINSVVETCQLQMGLTELQQGSVWNTMPAHTHDRRMEAYLYFNLPEDQVVSHFMGEPQETRHLFVKNRQAVISPPWSIHSGAGTYNYAFIWGMAGENLDYNDMDKVQPTDLK
ncbi:5-dehydro-4-deoxy-D-glucuronate isomerase [Pontibacter akesuensis]|uniref:4-deoxy-L-threo-5-hexosulose-uronate ketol-isomerase n=1 Tax=Pontibacter akesuensis TaxID=388950 RepID=A0A1I7K5R1_9BACT|nr:5-dehydro-4-deoxy-D-glucuronate isomerase [Pontibacter akesuensis]GHA74851.1 4-deoxy-L-threo-5-hexosulose-uronate ketol-isomerase [Pontibacter akesuensis]SFU92783.1 4-deoxy-L-threo-5-hexosulose-uronate ketol-isomerase [Pontibacter akesuensis]